MRERESVCVCVFSYSNIEYNHIRRKCRDLLGPTHNQIPLRISTVGSTLTTSTSTAAAALSAKPATATRRRVGSSGAGDALQMASYGRQCGVQTPQRRGGSERIVVVVLVIGGNASE